MSDLAAAHSNGSAASAASALDVLPIRPSYGNRAAKTKTQAGLWDLVADMAKGLDDARIELRDGFRGVDERFDRLEESLLVLQKLVLEALSAEK